MNPTIMKFYLKLFTMNKGPIMKTIFYLLLALCGASFCLWVGSAFAYDAGLVSRAWFDLFTYSGLCTGLAGYVVGKLLIYGE